MIPDGRGDEAEIPSSVSYTCSAWEHVNHKGDPCSQTALLSTASERSPRRPPPVRPRLLTQHLVPLQARLVGLPEGVAGPPHAHVLQEAQVADLVAHQGLAEDVSCFLVIGFDAPEREPRR